MDRFIRSGNRLFNLDTVTSIQVDKEIVAVNFVNGTHELIRGKDERKAVLQQLEYNDDSPATDEEVIANHA